MRLNEYIKERATLIEEALENLLPAEDVYPRTIHEAIHYSLFAGGKRLRPILCLAGAEAVEADFHPLVPTACALEMIHTYSLIHDDLPAMDDDDYRRGKLTNHKVFGEGIAVLAGDALLTLAFEILAAQKDYPPAKILQVIGEIAGAAGTFGMIGGQVVDILSEGKDIDRKTLNYIHAHKTGALFRAAVRAGALLAGAKGEHLAALTGFAEHFGLAFQITDDLLDVVGDETKLGKPIGSDEKKEKSTYPQMFGISKSRELAEESILKAVSCLQILPGRTKPLELLVRSLAERQS